MPTKSMREVPTLISKLLTVRNQLVSLSENPDPLQMSFFDNRSFGLAWSAYLYDVNVWRPNFSYQTNAKTKDGRQLHLYSPLVARSCPEDECDRPDLSSPVKAPTIGVSDDAEHLVVLFVSVDGEVCEWFNGPVSRVATGTSGRHSPDGYYETSLEALEELMHDIPAGERLPWVRPLPKERQGPDSRVEMPLHPSAEQDIPELMSEFYSLAREVNAALRDHVPEVVSFHEGPTAQVWARYLYGLRIWNRSFNEVNAETPDGSGAHVVSTHGMLHEVHVGDQAQHLLLLGMNEDGVPEEMYNGPNELVREDAYPVKDHDDRFTIPISHLRRLMKDVPEKDRLPTLRPLR